MFEAYHIEISQNYNLNEFLSDDLKNNKTNIFAKMVLNDNRRYELGKMTRIMSLLKEGGNTLQESELLQDFKKFVNKYFDERILAREFINDLEKIRDEFRNKAAHPYLISLEVAQKCQQLLRKNLNLFLESKK